jgi:tetratricopeptide (TPR) repeat protein
MESDGRKDYWFVTKYLETLGAAWLLLAVVASAQTVSNYDSLVQKGKTQLQADSADLALASSEEAIKMNADRWEGFALAGGALMNLKRYEDAADKLSDAIRRAPEAKQATLRDLRRQCLLAESGASPAAKETPPATTTQAEIVLWKSIENGSNLADFQSYLDQYPHGAFVVLARRHLSDAKAQAQQEQQRLKTQAEDARRDLAALVGSIWVEYPVVSGVPASGTGTFWVFVDGTVYRKSVYILKDVVHPKHNHDDFVPMLADAKTVTSAQHNLDWFRRQLLETGTYITTPPATVEITDRYPYGSCKGPPRKWVGTISLGTMTGTYLQEEGHASFLFSASVGCDAASGGFKLERLNAN